jgi:hypothetical protein
MSRKNRLGNELSQILKRGVGRALPVLVGRHAELHVQSTEANSS